MYGPGGNHITDAIATSPVGDCFAFHALYGGPVAAVNTRAKVTKAPWYSYGFDTSGGTCATAPCSGSAGIANVYTVPAQMIGMLANAKADTWTILSTYKLVTGPAH